MADARATGTLFCHREVNQPFAENAWLLGDPNSGAAVLIDPGGGVGALMRIVADRGLRVGGIWLTHAHLDHISGVAEAVAATGAPVWLHRDDMPLYAAVEQQGAMFGLQVGPQPRPDRWFEPGQELPMGGASARVLFLPGHSPGHVGFWFSAQRILISGDVLFAGSIGRTDLPGGSQTTLMHSIRTQLLPLGDDVRVLTGHGPETTIGREVRDNPFLHDMQAPPPSQS